MKRELRRTVIGVGGNIGAGKTTASHYLANMGANYLSADRIGWEVLSEIAPVLRKRFGKKIMKKNRIDRKRLGEMVFNNHEVKECLNRLSHPRLKGKIKRAIRRDQGIMVLDAALLFQWRDIMSKIDYPILVTASRNIKSRRAAKRGINRKAFDQILNVQMKDAEAAKMARYIAINCSSKKALSEQCRKIYKEIINDRIMQ
jgi:dephospho-CoA kinase